MAPHQTLSFIIGAVLGVASIVGLVAVKDPLMRRRLRHALALLVLWLGLYLAVAYSTPVPPPAGAPPGTSPTLFSIAVDRLRQIELVLLAFAAVNVLVALVFNPWLGRRTRDRAPSIVQDALVVIGVGVFAAFVFGNEMIGWSVGAAAVLGFGLQEQLGNLFAGLAIQIDRPFKVGHWVKINDFEGRITEVTWRATKILTKAGNHVIVPNSTIASSAVNNYSEPEAPTRMSVEVGATYLVPPNETKAAIMAAIRQVPRVLVKPASDVLLVEFADSAMTYRARFWVGDFADGDQISDEVRRAIFYEFNRRGIEIPWPIQIQYDREERPADSIERRSSFAQTIATVPVFANLSADVHRALADAASERLYAAEEEIVYEGEAGASMFVIRHGRVAVTIGTDHRQVATIESGGYFGEMSLLTGAPRSATVTARGDCTVLEINADAFRAYVRDHPEVIESLAAIAETRRKELERTRASVVSTGPETLSLKQRMKQFFGLA